MTTALLLMDFQNMILASRPEAGPAVAAAKRALDSARDAGIAVVFVRVAFRKGMPEVSVKNKSFGAAKASGAMFDETALETQIVDTLRPLPQESVVVKRRVGAFASDLAIVLSGLEATELVLAGVSTSGVVLSTIRDAADRDFGLTVLADACSDADDEVHRVLTQKVFPRQADVMNTDEWIATL